MDTSLTLQQFLLAKINTWLKHGKSGQKGGQKVDKPQKQVDSVFSVIQHGKTAML
jgi:hypothetical protein